MEPSLANNFQKQNSLALNIWKSK